MGTTRASPFDWDGFELGDADRLVAAFPSAENRIRDLLPGE